jgi:hypothetical protein
MTLSKMIQGTIYSILDHLRLTPHQVIVISLSPNSTLIFYLFFFIDVDMDSIQYIVNYHFSCRFVVPNWQPNRT